MSEKSQVFLPPTFIFLYRFVWTFQLSLVNFARHQLFPMFSFKFLCGKLVRDCKIIPICACLVCCRQISEEAPESLMTIFVLNFLFINFVVFWLFFFESQKETQKPKTNGINHHTLRYGQYGEWSNRTHGVQVSRQC